jgi:hypothetical protein
VTADVQPASPEQPRPSVPPGAAERGQRNLAILIAVTIGVLGFGLLVFAWMYWLAPIR